ncbi:hypothetical protein [Streptomyces agglomeratus]|uniref:hypothetical protein n=1 Tax=Streptomyces agglomeratus TaxID=285458 RepID=UPI001F0AFB85|nr:hypothetical protein [Streptomyces agglomeratus]
MGQRRQSALPGGGGVIGDAWAIQASPPTTTPPEGPNQATIETLLSNWHATLRLCQFDIQPMVKLYGTAFGLSENDLDTAAKQYDELLASYAP